MELKGLGNVLAALQELKTRYYEGKPPEVWIGYTQSYALYVHEVQASHTGPGRTGKWKYLTDPARRLNNDGTLKQLVLEALKVGTKLPTAMIRAGMRIQRESQKEVPVDTSALKASAVTAFAHEFEGKARTVFDQSEAIRLAELDRRRKARQEEEEGE